MATTKEYKDFILDKLEFLGDVRVRAMMGEYLLYYNNVLVGGIYDNRVLIKKVEGNKVYNMQEQIPYNNAKTMYLLDNLEDKELIKDIITTTYKDLR